MSEDRDAIFTQFSLMRFPAAQRKLIIRTMEGYVESVMNRQDYKYGVTARFCEDRRQLRDAAVLLAAEATTISGSLLYPERIRRNYIERKRENERERRTRIVVTLQCRTTVRVIRTH